MKILSIDPFGDALDLMLRAKECGHQVKMALGPDKHYSLVGKGLVDRVFDYKPQLHWADLIFLCDNTRHLDHLDAFRREYPKTLIFGPTKGTASWETDRLTGMEILKKHGIEIPSCKQFSSYAEAVAYVKKKDARLVCKPCGDADKALSYCSKSPEDMLFMLDKWHRSGQLKAKFILQDFVPGIEFAVSAYVGPLGFAGGWFENFEHKKLMTGDKGPATGEMGTTILCTDKSKLANKVLRPLEDAIVKAGYTGCIDVNCIIDDKGHPWPLEFTNRPGYPALAIETALFPEDPVQWMYDLLAEGATPKFTKNQVSLGVSMCLPPFPYPNTPVMPAIGMPIFGMTSSNRKHLHPYHIQKSTVPATEWMSAAEYTLVVTGMAETVSGAAKKAYKTIDQLNIPGSPLYRIDIGKPQQKQLPELHAKGYALAWNY